MTSFQLSKKIDIIYNFLYPIFTQSNDSHDRCFFLKYVGIL